MCQQHILKPFGAGTTQDWESCDMLQNIWLVTGPWVTGDKYQDSWIVTPPLKHMIRR